MILRHLEEKEDLAELCKKYGVSRKTGHKWKARYLKLGLEGLKDLSRKPANSPTRTPEATRKLFVDAKKEHPNWGPKKIKVWLEQKNPGLALPSVRTVEKWLALAGLVKRRGPRRRTPGRTPSELTKPSGPNDVWCADFKGQFRLSNGQYCFPLTITDLYSRYVITVLALDSTKGDAVKLAFAEAFTEYGLPKVIRTDNGAPFASNHGMAGLTRLSAFWFRLGIRPERIEAGHPEQNGQHERMHLTLKQETTRPPKSGLAQQQERFDEFREEFNEERPHEALGQKPPATIYRPSPRHMPKRVLPLEYPLHDFWRSVADKGSVSVSSKHRFFLSDALAYERVGLREVDAGKWLVSFMHLNLGQYNEHTKRFERAQVIL